MLKGISLNVKFMKECSLYIKLLLDYMSNSLNCMASTPFMSQHKHLPGSCFYNESRNLKQTDLDSLDNLYFEYYRLHTPKSRLSAHLSLKSNQSHNHQHMLRLKMIKLRIQSGLRVLKL